MSKIEDSAIGIAAPVKSVPPEDQPTVVALACAASDVMEATTVEGAVGVALQQAPGWVGYRATIEDLTEKLEEAQSSLEVTEVLGQALLCEAAGA